MTFLQRTFTSLVHAHAGRTQVAKVRRKKRGWDKHSQGFAQQRSHLPLGKALVRQASLMHLAGCKSLSGKV
ncbi:hypothetical protein [Paraglaciecola sp. 25GB23A]|uniref:hypothetical protein n=1 Tax=Paraglaciecola sp. 25GB23A TaxID=3156068 RepID=UPI0032B00A18